MFYKTGYLGKFNMDGSISFIGRNNTQVKIRGHRLELEEVEHHIQQYLDPDTSPKVVVECITPPRW